MKSQGARTIIETLGGDTVTRFVGGCVRNWLAGEEAGDIDLATQLLPQEVMKRLKAAGIKVVPTGIDHGTVTAVIDKTPYEITTLRRDVETDGRHAIVSFTDDWLEDAERRDFTINTLSANLHLKIFDPLGRGVDDLKKGKIVFVAIIPRLAQHTNVRLSSNPKSSCLEPAILIVGFSRDTSISAHCRWNSLACVAMETTNFRRRTTCQFS